MTESSTATADIDAGVVASPGNPGNPGSPRTAAASRKAAARKAILEGPILSTLLRLSLPTLIVLLAQTAVNIAEAYYVGFLGTSALAGVALVFPVFMLMMTMSAGGLGSGVGSAVARAVGAGRHEDADALVLHAIVLAVIVGAVFTLGILWCGPLLYRALGGRNAALDAAVEYSNNLFAASIAVWIVNLLAAALRGSGNVKVPATVTLIGALVMIPASPILIFGFGPIPRLGIGGAGLAFAIYYGVATLVLLRYMMSGRSGLTLKFARLEGRLFASILKVGAPAALNTVQTNLTVILVTGAVGLFGTSALAGYGIASRLDYVMIPILFGLSSGVLTMVGINIGAGQVARAKQIAWVSVAVGVGLTETIGLIVALWPLSWLHLFSHDANVLAPAMTYLHIVAPAYGLLGFGFVISFAAQGAGHVLWPYLGSTLRMIIAAGIGLIAVKFLGAGMPGLAAIVAASLAAYTLVTAIAMTSHKVWSPNRS
jgi:putative MATE family efflux protein